MRNEKGLIALLEAFVRLVSEEAEHNSEFSAKLDTLLSPILTGERPKKLQVRPPKREDLPDIYEVFTLRGPSEFQLWLRNQPIATLRALISVYDLDAGRRTSKWKEPEKLGSFIADQISGRLARGAGFLSAKDS